MENNIKIRREDYYVTHENDNSENKLKMDYRHTTFGTYEAWKEYLHIQVGDYNGFNLYLEMKPWEAEKVFLELAEKAKKLGRGI